MHVLQPRGSISSDWQCSMSAIDPICLLGRDCPIQMRWKLLVKQKEDGIFISQDKYVNEILKKFGFADVKTASTPMETQKPLLKDEDGEEVAYTDSDYAGVSLDRKSTTGEKAKNNVRLMMEKLAIDKNRKSVLLQALVDGKKVIITEATVRRDLQLEDAEVENVADEAVNKEMDDSLERASTTATGLNAEHDMGNINKTQSKATPNERSSLGTSSGGGPRPQDTIGDIIAQTRSENVSKYSNDSLLTRVNTPQSDEDRLKLKELMELYTNLQKKVLDLESSKTSQADEIASLKRRVKKLEKKDRKRTY
ncbi:hypothetical protein Tco_0880039 [Tanacetum coccineum]